MKALRIILTQNKAHYKKEEVDQNKLTYPLPPFSTVIGALHNACGFSEYKPMNLSIQGEYKSLSKQAYTDHCFLDNLENDRGILVKLVDGNCQSRAFVKVAQAKKNQGNSFRQGITIDVLNQELLEEYRSLKDLNDDIDIFKFRLNYGKFNAKKYQKIIYEKRNLTDNEDDKKRKKELDNEIKKLKESISKNITDLFKKRKNSIKEKKKKLDKKSEEFVMLSKREEQIKNKNKFITETLKKFEIEKYTKEITKYQTLTTSLKFYEILHEVKLIIHVEASEDILEKIKENIYSLKSIGRSEDFVDVKECEYVELAEQVEDEIISGYSAYLTYNLVKNKDILLNKRNNKIPASGTKYWINKVYNKEKGFRDFEKVKVVYASNFIIDEDSENIFYDGKYVVNFN